MSGRGLNRSCTRRQMLEGAGVALALPWLPSLGGRARAQEATARRRYVALYFPNGTADYWKPKAQGSSDGWALSPILEPLAPVKRYVSVLGNVSNYSPFGGHVEPSHSNCCASTWTCVKPSGDGQKDNAISVDQVIANALAGSTPLPSIQVGLSTMDSSPDGLPGQHSRSISWKSPTEPLYKTVNPQAVFDRLTSGGLGGASMATDQAAAMRRRALRKSVLDFVLDDATALQRKLSVSDRRKLDQVLTSVRSLEQRVADPSMQVTRASCQLIARPTETYALDNVPDDYDRGRHASLMIDLTVMALQCDITRVVSFMLDDARSDFVYDFITERRFTADGSTPTSNRVGGYHGLQHAGDGNDGFATIGWWNAERAAELAGKLALVEDGVDEGAAGNLLENTVIAFCSGMHSGNHDAGDLPLALIGGGGKTASGTVLKMDRHVRYPQEQRIADVHLTVMQHVFGLPDEKFGASSGVIEDLLA